MFVAKKTRVDFAQSVDPLSDFSDYVPVFGESMSTSEVSNHLDLPGVFTPFCAAETEFAEQHTIDHRNCPACQAADAALRGGNLHLATKSFRDASRYWMQLRRQSVSLKPRAHEATQTYLNALNLFFGDLRLCDITPGQIRAYQIARTTNSINVGGQQLHPWKRTCQHGTINHEINVLAMILNHCELWPRIRPFYFPLSVPTWSPRTVLTEVEEERLFSVAREHPEASLAYWVACITNNTTAAGIELRRLRLGNLFLTSNGISEIYVPGDAVKNTHRPRKIPLNAPAKWAIEQCFKRALMLGCCEPDHYLFPFRVLRNQFDPTRPASRSWLRKSWDKLRKATGFTKLTPHDLRHHCITRMLENDVNPETVIAIAGHVSRKMMEYYAHQRTRVKYAAVVAIDPTCKITATPDHPPILHERISA
jgi:integrase